MVFREIQIQKLRVFVRNLRLTPEAFFVLVLVGAWDDQGISLSGHGNYLVRHLGVGVRYSFRHKVRIINAAIRIVIA